MKNPQGNFVIFVSHCFIHSSLLLLFFRNDGKLKGYNGYMGRIVSVVPVNKANDDDETTTDTNPSDPSLSSDQYKYDIDLELGNVLHGIDRSDLHYTTEESRSRRKRKPTSIRVSVLKPEKSATI